MRTRLKMNLSLFKRKAGGRTQSGCLYGKIKSVFSKQKCSCVQPEEKEISKTTSMFNKKHQRQNYLKFYFSTFNSKMCLPRCVLPMPILCVRSIKWTHSSDRLSACVIFEVVDVYKSPAVTLSQQHGETRTSFYS